MLDTCWLHRLLAWGLFQALLGHFQFASLPRMSANCNARTKLIDRSLCECGLICGCPSILQAYGRVWYQGCARPGQRASPGQPRPGLRCTSALVWFACSIWARLLLFCVWFTASSLAQPQLPSTTKTRWCLIPANPAWPMDSQLNIFQQQHMKIAKFTWSGLK